jgi:cell division protein FtsL
VALATVFSFSQDSTKYVNKDSLEARISSLEAKFETEQNTIKKSVDSLGNVKKEAFKQTLEFYSDYASSFIAVVTLLVMILVAFTGALVFINFKSNDNLKEDLKDANKQIKSQKTEFERLKQKIEKDFENDRKKNQEQIDNSSRLHSRLYRVRARENLEKNDFSGYLWEMHFYLHCLTGINSLNEDDLKRFKDTYDLLEVRRNKCNIENNDAICWFVVYLLKFMKHCKKDTKRSEHFVVANTIYKELCDIFCYDDIRKKLEICMKNDRYKSVDIQEILELAELYRDKSTKSS